MRSALALLSLLLTTLLLAACAGNPAAGTAVATGGSPLWYSIDDRVGLTADEMKVLEEGLQAALAPRRVAPGTAGAQHLRITLTSYRMLHESGRAVVGMVSGTDHVASTVQWIDPAGNRLLREERVLTRAGKSIGAAGDMLGRHATQIGRLAAD